MAGQWEVVGKKKDKSNKGINQKAANNKKPETLSINVEEVLTKSQVQSLYSSIKGKENKPQGGKKVPESGTKKVQKKQDKPVEPPKPKPPKSIESALNQINVEEFENVFVKSKSQFPDAPIVWLKELAHFLNQKVNIDLQDPVFTTKPQKYPLVIVPAGIESVIEKAVRDATKSNVQLFYDISLTTMASDMSKNLSAFGFKIFLQYIALENPNLASENLSKHCILRNSYQNRPNIGLSILWAVGQAGLVDFQTGLKVFNELMLPLIELKNYSKYVVKYLIDLISKCDASSAYITKEQYVSILETIYVAKKNFPSDLKQDLIGIAPSLKSLLLSNDKKLSSSLEFFLKKIGVSDSSKIDDSICDVIVESFVNDPTNLDSWSKVYAKNIQSSATLLKVLDQNWKNVSNKLNRNILRDALTQINTTSGELLLKKKKDEALVTCSELSKQLLEKMAVKAKPKSSYKLKVFLVLLAVAAFVNYDIYREGSWKNSKTNKFFKDVGVSEYSHKLLDKIKEGLLYVDGQIEQNFPEYRRQVVQFSEPYVELLQKLGRVFCNIASNVKEAIVEKYPVLIQSVESYAPGVLEQSQNVLNGAWSASVLYFNRSIDYLRKEVFVGQLSPENMQKVVVEAFNVTQVKATEYYYWLYQKVQSTIK